MNIWIIGDIHGCFETFKALLDRLPTGDRVCLVGDLIDRGPKSKEVVQYVIDNKIDTVKGNHEVMMVENPSYWSLNGGHETLLSYSTLKETALGEGHLHKFLDVPLFDEHKEWMDKLPVYIEYPDIKNADGKYLVVSHSTLHNVWKFRNDPERTLQFNQSAMWSRDFRMKVNKENEDIFNVFGHTPQKYTVGASSLYANVDTGCCFPQYEEHGVLTAMSFPEMKIIKQTNIDMWGE